MIKVPRGRARRKLGADGGTNAFSDRLQPSGDELMLPEAYLDRLAFIKQASGVHETLKCRFSPIPHVFKIQIYIYI